jgi:FkbM family methyltransferase
MDYFISYAQNGEDILLHRALKDVVHGFYIDIGAQDPVEDSVTKAFYERGWRGINVEPVQYWHARLAADRPHDINLQAAASDRNGELKLFEVADSGLSTSNPDVARGHAKSGLVVRETRVACLTLDEICARYSVERVHFLKIDCEGTEQQVLQGFSLDAVRPWVIVVEATKPNSSKPTWKEWENLLTERGYQYVYTDGLSRYYIAKEHPELRDSFRAPPNPLDWSIRAVEVRAHEAVKRLSAELTELRSAEQRGKLEAERDYLRNENIRREAALERLRAEDQARAIQWANLTAELDRVRIEERDLRVNFERLLSEKGLCESKLAEEVLARQELQIRLRIITASRSWRITAPLRLAGRNLRRFRAFTTRATLAGLRPLAHLARPGLRTLAQRRPARSLAVGVFGRNSRLVKSARLFLFGAPAAAHSHAAPGEPASGTQTEPLEHSRQERQVLAGLQGALARSKHERT